MCNCSTWTIISHSFRLIGDFLFISLNTINIVMIDYKQQKHYCTREMNSISQRHQDQYILLKYSILLRETHSDRSAFGGRCLRHNGTRHFPRILSNDHLSIENGPSNLLYCETVNTNRICACNRGIEWSWSLFWSKLHSVPFSFSFRIFYLLLFHVVVFDLMSIECNFTHSAPTYGLCFRSLIWSIWTEQTCRTNTKRSEPNVW